MKLYLHISPGRFIHELRSDFNEAFPFLNLEFLCTKRVLPKKSREELHPHQKKIGDCQNNVTDGVLEIDSQMRVCDLEKKLEDQYNLPVQVFRRSGNVWIQTTITDNWTLQQQNEHGREISTEKVVEEKHGDFDLERDT